MGIWSVFFKAGVKAGLNSFVCDVNIRTLDDRHMSQFQLLDVIPVESPYSVNLIFFFDSTAILPASSQTFISQINRLIQEEGFEKEAYFELVDFDVIEFKVLIGENNPQKSFEAAIGILSRFGNIRSINGLVPKVSDVQLYDLQL